MSAKTRLEFSSDGLTHNPFGALMGDAASQQNSQPPPAVLTNTDPLPSSASEPFCIPQKLAKTKIVVRFERKGRGGKTATVIELGHLAPPQLERVCAELRAFLGCGGFVESTSVVLGGEQCARAESWLRDRGALRIVRG